MTYETTQHLAHFGIKGQKWYVRRFQYEDGTLTPGGKIRYAKSTSKLNQLSAKRDKAHLKKAADALETKAAVGNSKMQKANAKVAKIEATMHKWLSQYEFTHNGQKWAAKDRKNK